MMQPNWDEINKKKELDIAVGQAVNICAGKGITPTDDNIKIVLNWTNFILKCKEASRNQNKTQQTLTESDL